MAQRWYVVKSEPAHERKAEADLRRRGFEAFCPMKRELGKDSAGKPAVISRPLLCGYLFVSLDLGREGWGEAKRALHVQYILPEHDAPREARRDVVERLMYSDIVSAGVTLDEMLWQQKRLAKRNPWKGGTPIWVKEGVFTGLGGKVVADLGGAELEAEINGWLTKIPSYQVEMA